MYTWYGDGEMCVYCIIALLLVAIGYYLGDKK